VSSVSTPYLRRNYGCEAVQVSEKNLYKVAAWCGGRVKRARIDGVDRLYIEVPVALRTGGTTAKRAYVGEWVILDPDGFKVYDNKEFNTIFKPWPERF